MKRVECLFNSVSNEYHLDLEIRPTNMLYEVTVIMALPRVVYLNTSFSMDKAALFTSAQ